MRFIVSRTDDGKIAIQAAYLGIWVAQQGKVENLTFEIDEEKARQLATDIGTAIRGDTGVID